ncbi:MAG TPA: SLBB domain-containing protein [Candidatus Syntrophosphaera thermopropionivorans]|nr:SLBB domain-containing protein [Candidatus Syntrophosphaera thermopropionivorans]HQP84321.1 SLBB domain-containing protein [Candidatus Syntrophosphaera thermopropionivorans]
MKKILLFIIITSFTVLAFAQAGNVVVTSTSTSAYSYEGTGAGAQKLKMNVYILGRVNKPGLYLVPDDTDFPTLLALAGGPAEDAKLSKIRIIRPVNPTLDAESEPEVIWLDFKKYMDTADNKYLATKTIKTKVIDEFTGEEIEHTVYDLRLQPGDTVVVSGTIFYAFDRIADFLSKVAIALSVYNLIANIK